MRRRRKHQRLSIRQSRGNCPNFCTDILSCRWMLMLCLVLSALERGPSATSIVGTSGVSRRLYVSVLSVWRTSKEREHHGRWVAELMVTARDLPLFVHRPHFFSFVVFAWFSLMVFCPISAWSLLSSLLLVHQLDVGVPPNGTLFLVPQQPGICSLSACLFLVIYVLVLAVFLPS